MDRVLVAVREGDYDQAARLLREIVYGTSGGEHTDPGMAGSLLYHMAMVTKMEAETRFLLQEFESSVPPIETELWRFYSDFASDVSELSGNLSAVNLKPSEITAEPLGTSEKISLLSQLTQKTTIIFQLFKARFFVSIEALETLYKDWATHVICMRLRQEYETIKGLLVTYDLAKAHGIQHLRDAMERVQDRFGQETVSIALDVTLKVGMRREKLQTIMLSDHFIDYKLNVAELAGSMQFFNCPVAGSHKYINEKLEMNDEVATLFCNHFCYAHAQAMLEAVLPFTFTLSQSQRISTHGKCEFIMKIANSPSVAMKGARFVPLVISWNVTRKCNLKCPHCYINATKDELRDELTTEEAKLLINQISDVSRPLLILSGGEPLLREDIYDIVHYGASKGFRMGLGSNGTLIDHAVARRLKEAGIKTVSISLDSSISKRHDDFRGVEGSWQKAVQGITALKQNGVLVQVNTTVTQQNHFEIDEIMSIAEQLGVENFHLFFLVPTGRGAKIADISPAMYEGLIKTTFAKTGRHKLNVRPSCAPQFMRIAKDMGLDMRQWIRGCLAGLYYCRVYPNGDITPCPYLPLKLGNVREESFAEIWFNSEIFKDLRDFNKLKGKCGACENKHLCGGCRARAYGLASDFIDFCGDLHEPTVLKGDYLKEDPWCVYNPNPTN